MAGIAAGISSSGVLRARESGSNAASLVQYSGLRPSANMPIASIRPIASWLISTRGKIQWFPSFKCAFFSFFSFFLFLLLREYNVC